MILAIHCDFFICSLLLFFYLGVQLYLNVAKIRIAVHMKCTAQSKEKSNKSKKKVVFEYENWRKLGDRFYLSDQLSLGESHR